VPDPAQPDHSDGLAEDLGAENDERFHARSRSEHRLRESGGRPTAARQRVFGGAVDVDVGALTTSTPRWLAFSRRRVQADAGTATIFSFARVEHLGVDGGRRADRSASASGTAASSFSRPGRPPSALRCRRPAPRR